jgi:hypothetical protein
MTEGCGCEAEALLRVLAVRDAIDLVLWGEADPLRGVDVAIVGLQNARRMFIAAGFEAQEP